MLNSSKGNHPRISPSEITQISFNFAPAPIINKTAKLVPKNEKVHKCIRKKWKYFSRILLRRFTIRFSKELYRVSLTVIQLRNFYMKCKFKRWIFRFKWSKMAHKIHKIYFIRLIQERRLKFLEKKKRIISPNKIKWRTMVRLLITSENRRKLYLERELLIRQRKKEIISKWNEMYLKIRPRNLQNIQLAFEEKRHAKYIYRKYFIRWLLKCHNQEDSIGYIFKVEYPEMFLYMHLNMPFDFGPYSCPITEPFISKNISLLKDIYDFNETLYYNEIENMTDLFALNEFDDVSLLGNVIPNLYSLICSCRPVKIPEIVIPVIFDDFNDMYSHLFLTNENLDLSVSNSLSYFQSCPQFQFNDNIDPNVSLSLNSFSHDSLSHLNNYKEKVHPNAEASNINVNIPLNLSQISGECARSLSQFQVKPASKEQNANAHFNLDLGGIKNNISNSSLLNFRYYIKKHPNPKVDSDVSLSFQSISNQNHAKNIFANFHSIEIKRSARINNFYDDFNDLERQKSFDNCLVNYIDSNYNIFGNLQGFTSVDIPNSNSPDGIKIDIFFIEDIFPYHKIISYDNSNEHVELSQSSSKSQDVANNSSNTKTINKVAPIHSSTQDSNANIKFNLDAQKKDTTSSEDDITIDIEIDLKESIPTLHQNSNMNLIKKKSASKSIDENANKPSFNIYLFDPNLFNYARELMNYQFVKQEKELFDVDVNDLLINPNISDLIEQPKIAIRKMNNSGPSLKLLLSSTNNDEYAKEILFEEEEEEFDDIAEEEEEEIDIDSINFNCLDPLYLDIPLDIFYKITRATKSLDSSNLIQSETDNLITYSYINSTLSSSRILEKSRYVPYIFQLASKIYSPLYIYQSQIGKERSYYFSLEQMISKVTKNSTSIMSKVRQTPSFLNLYSPLIDNILRLNRYDYSMICNDNINFGIRPKVIHASHFLSNVKKSLSPIALYEKGTCNAKQPELLLLEKGFILPKVRQSPHILSCISSTLNILNSFGCKKAKIQSIKPKFGNILKVENKNYNDESSIKIVKKKVVRKVKRRIGENCNSNNNVVNLKGNRITKKTSLKRTITETAEKIVFSPMTIINNNDDEVDYDYDDYDNDKRERNKCLRKIKFKSSNTSMIKFKSNSNNTKTKTKAKRRANSARFTRTKLPDGTTMTFRKIVIEADNTYDDENEINQSNIDALSNKEEGKVIYKSRKRKRRGCSVNHENNSPRKLNQK